ncbi:MAG: SDR family oxidoreductase [Phreatobacter sp.]|uniref:SDR family oxidoreductase n=1 Tax=Phreatobacter sp. TaxID=1966341 RepID=UPI001A393193|nr:SDR family oxidoreductase [Phreatobacter sp.]MBL8570902.1 SDR family oxidoreductase [Phreatobacter sp.]
MDLGLKGKSAIICGGSRGMGRAAADMLAAEGVALTILARNRERLDAVAADIRARFGVVVTPVAGDVTTEAGRAAALAACPNPDILINNADGMPPGDFRVWTRDDWIAALDAMMLSPIALMKATVDGMMARGFGRIVNIVSRSVKIPQLEMGLSNGARSGLVGFVAGLARQTVAKGVTINNVLPGIVATDAQKHHVEKLAEMTGRPFDDIWAERGAQNPAGRYGEAAEIGATIAFLCSVHAGFITGQSILVDGGQYPGTY